MKNKIILVIVIILFILQCYFGGINKENEKDTPTQTAITTTAVETTISTTTPTAVTSITAVTTESTTETTVLETEITIPETELTTEEIVTVTETIIEEIIEEPVESYIVYKPSTHYIHLSDCKWVSDECYEITDTYDLETRRCNVCNPDMEIINEYVEPEPETSSNDGLTYVKHFSRGTYYSYGYECYGGSGRYLIDCSYGSNGIKGSIASSYIYRNYGYNYNGERTKVYLEVYGYPSMSGWYFVDDSDAGNSEVIDFFYIYSSNCPFRNQGVVEVDCYI